MQIFEITPNIITKIFYDISSFLTQGSYRTISGANHANNGSILHLLQPTTKKKSLACYTHAFTVIWTEFQLSHSPLSPSVCSPPPPSTGQEANADSCHLLSDFAYKQTQHLFSLSKTLQSKQPVKPHTLFTFSTGDCLGTLCTCLSVLVCGSELEVDKQQKIEITAKNTSKQGSQSISICIQDNKHCSNSSRCQCDSEHGQLY